MEPLVVVYVTWSTYPLCLDDITSMYKVKYISLYIMRELYLISQKYIFNLRFAVSEILEKSLITTEIQPTTGNNRSARGWRENVHFSSIWKFSRNQHLIGSIYFQINILMILFFLVCLGKWKIIFYCYITSNIAITLVAQRFKLSLLNEKVLGWIPVEPI